jgi:hypothetical protein
MAWVDDSGFDVNGGLFTTSSGDTAPRANRSYFNNNIVAIGALVSGYDNIVSSGNGVIVTGNNNYIAPTAINTAVMCSSGVTVLDNTSNISVVASTGVTVLSGVSNIAVTNSSGVTITESNVSYNNGIKTLNSSTYKKYIAILSQYGTDDPLVNVLENTMSSGITCFYNSVGEYFIESSAYEFIEGKTFVMINQTSIYPSGLQFIIYAKRVSNTTIVINTLDLSLNVTDQILNETAIDIRVYS